MDWQVYTIRAVLRRMSFDVCVCVRVCVFMYGGACWRGRSISAATWKSFSGMRDRVFRYSLFRTRGFLLEILCNAPTYDNAIASTPAVCKTALALL